MGASFWYYDLGGYPELDGNMIQNRYRAGVLAWLTGAEGFISWPLQRGPFALNPGVIGRQFDDFTPYGRISNVLYPVTEALFNHQKTGLGTWGEFWRQENHLPDFNALRMSSEDFMFSVISIPFMLPDKSRASIISIPLARCFNVSKPFCGLATAKASNAKATA